MTHPRTSPFLPSLPPSPHVPSSSELEKEKDKQRQHARQWPEKTEALERASWGGGVKKASPGPGSQNPALSNTGRCSLVPPEGPVKTRASGATRAECDVIGDGVNLG